MSDLVLKCAASLEAIYNHSSFELLHLQCEMDQEVEIKEEPVWLEGTANTSLEDFERVSEIIPLKQETKSELTEPVPTQGNTFESATDIKDEIIIEEHTVDELDPCFKEENSMANGSLVTRSSHSDEELYFCDVCDRTYRQKTSFLKHVLIHSGEKSTSSKEINEVIVERVISREHNYCYATRSEKEKRIEPPTRDGLIRCKKCNRTFSHRSYLLKHMVIHSAERPYRCRKCNSSFRRRTDQRRHILIHTGERLYRCDQCKSNFITRSQMQNHALVHTGERPFRCDTCNKTFSTRSNLRVHTVIHTGERPYACKECNKTFAQRSNLRTHMRIHTGEKPYHCNECNRTFPRKVGLQFHMAVHTGVGPSLFRQ